MKSTNHDTTRTQPAFTVFVDESGDEGFKLGGGSTDFFVLSGVIVPHDQEAALVQLVNETRDVINQAPEGKRFIPPRKPLHFRDLTPAGRQVFVGRIAAFPLRAVAIVMDKRRLNRDAFAPPALYHYAVRLLLERIARYCDEVQTSTPAFEFSNRASMNYDALREYVKDWEDNRATSGYAVSTGFVASEQITTNIAGRRVGLQVADAVAGSVYYAVQEGRQRSTVYLDALMPCFCGVKEQEAGYGLTFYPSEVEPQ